MENVSSLELQPFPSNARIADLTGKTFGKLTVLGYSGKRQFSKQHHSVWVCRCECGDIRTYLNHNLVRGNSASCGKREHGNYPSAKEPHPLRRLWYGMIRRCTDVKLKTYKYYGAKGVKVCDRWMDFDNFVADMGPRPSLDHSIDRYPDPCGNYEPSNCRWATYKQQGENKRNNIRMTLNGETMNLSDWAKRLGWSKQALSVRKKLGWSDERALTTPMGEGKIHPQRNGVALGPAVTRQTSACLHPELRQIVEQEAESLKIGVGVVIERVLAGYFGRPDLAERRRNMRSTNGKNGHRKRAS